MLLDSLPPTAVVPLSYSSTGTYIGIDVISGSSVYWDLELSSAPHLLVIGPSGSGKSVTLSALVHRFVRSYNVNAIIFDIKDEYRYLFSMYTDRVLIFNPVEVPLPLCFCEDQPTKKLEMINIAIESLSKVYTLSTQARKYLAKILVNVCNRCLDIDSIWNYEVDVYDKEISKATSTLTTLFNVYTNRLSLDEEFLGVYTSKQRRISIVNLKQIFVRDRLESALVVTYILKYMLSTFNVSITQIPINVVVLDELWHVLPFLGDEFVNMLARYSRSLGIAMFMATQGVEDLHPYIDTIINSCGLFMAMSAPSISYWQKLQRYLNLSKKAIDYAMSISGQGIAVARISPYKIPTILYVDPLDNFEE
jgi:DNA polymerase III delta prime subunit